MFIPSPSSRPYTFLPTSLFLFCHHASFVILYTAHVSTTSPRIPVSSMRQDFWASICLGRPLSWFTRAPKLRSMRLRFQKYRRIGRGELVRKFSVPTDRFTSRRQHQKGDCVPIFRCAPCGIRIALDDLAEHRRDSPNHPTCNECNLGFDNTADYTQVKYSEFEWV